MMVEEYLKLNIRKTLTFDLTQHRETGLSMTYNHTINFADKITMLSDNGAKTVIVPMANLNELANGPTSVLVNTDVPFYSNKQMLIQKGILGE